MRTLIFLAAALAGLALAGCAPPDCSRDGRPWVVDGDAPAAFLAEAAASVSYLQRVSDLCGGGTIHVRPAPWRCGTHADGTDRYCAGDDDGSGTDVTVAYDESVGLGPRVGSTALEHELCHAAGVDESGVADCAVEVVAEIGSTP